MAVREGITHRLYRNAYGVYKQALKGFRKMSLGVREFNIKATKGFWTPERDKKLIQLVERYGGKLSWNQLSTIFPGTKGKYLRQRYRNHLDPNLKQHPWTWEEDQILKKCYLKYNNQWELISRYLPGRSANQVKNRTKRQQFRLLFPQPPSLKKRYPPTKPPLGPKPTIQQEKQAIKIKQEHNHRILMQQVIKEREKEVVEEQPLPKKLDSNSYSSRKKLSKTKRLELAAANLHKIYQMIKTNLTKKQPSDFYLIFQHKTKKDILRQIKEIQWIINQIWPLVTNRVSKLTHDQETTFFLYCLLKTDNIHANRILHRLLKCRQEEYLMKKIDKIIEDIDNFIKLELDIIRQKELFEKTAALNQKIEQKEEFEQTVITIPQSQMIGEQQSKIEEAKVEKRQMDLQMSLQKGVLDQKQSQQRENIEENEEKKAQNRIRKMDFRCDFDYDFAIVGDQKIIGTDKCSKDIAKQMKIQNQDPENVNNEEFIKEQREILQQHLSQVNQSQQNLQPISIQDDENYISLDLSDEIVENRITFEGEQYLKEVDFIIDVEQLSERQLEQCSQSISHSEQNATNSYFDSGEILCRVKYQQEQPQQSEQIQLSDDGILSKFKQVFLSRFGNLGKDEK